MLYTTKKEEYGNMINNQKEVQVKLTKGLLDMIILQFLKEQPMHGYEVITKIRKSLGVYFGPSSIYPLLGSLEKKGQVSSVWNMESERPRKVYKLTNEGQELLTCTEKSLSLIFRTIGVNHEQKNTNEPEVGITAAFRLGRARVNPVFVQ